jgi:hypothetical protein
LKFKVVSLLLIHSFFFISHLLQGRVLKVTFICLIKWQVSFMVTCNLGLLLLNMLICLSTSSALIKLASQVFNIH